MEVVKKTVSQLRQRFSGPDTPTSSASQRSVSRDRERGDSKCGDEVGEGSGGGAAEKDDALMKLVGGGMEDARPRLTALLVNYIGKRSTTVGEDEFGSMLRAAGLCADELSKGEVGLVRRELDGALDTLAAEDTSAGVYETVEMAVTRVLSRRR